MKYMIRFLAAVVIAMAGGNASADVKCVINAAAGVDQQVVGEFRLFSEGWVDTINRNMKFSKDNPDMVPNGRGYVPKYSEIDRTSLDLTIKPSSDVSSCPYVGILRYKEKEFTCAGVDTDGRAFGPCVCERIVRYTEIFRYAGGEWEH